MRGRCRGALQARRDGGGAAPTPPANCFRLEIPPIIADNYDAQIVSPPPRGGLAANYITPSNVSRETLNPPPRPPLTPDNNGPTLTARLTGPAR